MINIDLIKYEMRARLFNAGIVNLEDDFKGSNLPSSDFSGKPFFIEEYYGGDNTVVFSSNRRIIKKCNIQYGIHVPVGTGTSVLAEKEFAIRNEFDMLDENKRVIKVDGMGVRVISIDVSQDIQTNVWCIRPVKINLMVEG